MLLAIFTTELMYQFFQLLQSPQRILLPPTTPVTPTDPSTPTTPVDPTDPSTPTINVKNNISNELSSSLKVKDEVDTTTDSQEKLPQTGNKSSVIYSIFGLILTSLLGVWANVRKH